MGSKVKTQTEESEPPAPKKAAKAKKSKKAKKSSKTADGVTKRRKNCPLVDRMVYVGGLPYQTTQEEVEAYFGMRNLEVEHIDWLTTNDEFNGIVIITFPVKTMADQAKALHGELWETETRTFADRWLVIKAYEPPKSKTHEAEAPRNPDYNVAFCCNLSPAVDEAALTTFFKQKHLHVESVRLGQKGNLRFAHVVFDPKYDNDVWRAVSFNQTKLMGRPLKIAYAQRHRASTEAPENLTVIVRNIGREATFKGIVKTFRRFGEIKDLHLPKGKNVGFVKFGTLEEARECVNKANGQKLGETYISVNFAQPKDETERDEEK